MLPNLRHLRTPARVAITVAAVLLACGLTGLCAFSGAQGSPRAAAALMLGGTAFAAALTGGVLWLTRRGAPVERIFLLMYLPLSLAMMIAMPVFRVPDEPAHLQRAYLLSTGQFLPREGLFMQPENLMAGYVEGGMRLSDARALFHASMSPNLVAVEPNEATGVYPMTAHLPQALTMAIARLFTANQGVVLYAGRLGSWLATLMMFYAAIRLTPCGKSVMLVISLLPVTLQEAVSASADGMAVACVMLLVALVLRVREEGRLFRGARRLLCVTAVGLVSFKVIYAPFLLLTFLLPKEAFADARKRRAAWGYAWLCALLTLALWAWAGLYPGAVEGSHSGQVMAQMLAAVRAPHQFLWLVLRTVGHEATAWGWQMLGGTLGWPRFHLQPPVVVLLAALLIYVTCRDRAMTSPRGVRLAFWGLSLISAFIIVVSIYAWWSPEQSALIEGIQGRYFLPFAAPVLMGLASLRRNRELRGPIADEAYALTALLCVCSIISVLTHTLA